jgi:hypothetical protein
MEEDERHLAAAVRHDHLPRRARARARPLVALHLDLHRDQPLLADLADRRPGAAVGDRARQVEEEVDDARLVARRVEEPRQEVGVAAPDARQRLHRGEQRVEEGWAHDRCFWHDRRGGEIGMDAGLSADSWRLG